MFSLFSRLLTTKTLWAAVIAIITAVAAYQAGTITLAQAIQLIVTALLGITIRDAVAKSDRKVALIARKIIEQQT